MANPRSRGRQILCHFCGMPIYHQNCRFGGSFLPIQNSAKSMDFPVQRIGPKVTLGEPPFPGPPNFVSFLWNANLPPKLPIWGIILTGVLNKLRSEAPPPPPPRIRNLTKARVNTRGPKFEAPLPARKDPLARRPAAGRGPASTSPDPRQDGLSIATNDHAP